MNTNRKRSLSRLERDYRRQLAREDEQLARKKVREALARLTKQAATPEDPSVLKKVRAAVDKLKEKANAS